MVAMSMSGGQSFLSTPSARRATSSATPNSAAARRFLSTPSARRATDVAAFVFGENHISIHALREEGDPYWLQGHLSHSHFYPRPPRGGRLPRPHLSYDEAEISIHALREEGDPAIPENPRRGLEISIHALREEGDAPNGAGGAQGNEFLSTPSARRATVRNLSPPFDNPISIHALREEGDARENGEFGGWNYFYPRPPRGGRP